MVQAPDNCSRTVETFGFTGTGGHLRENTLSIRLGRGIRVDVQHRQTGGARYGRGCVAKFDPQHLIQVRRRIGADQQNLLACVRQGQGRRGRERRFSNAAFASEEQMSGRLAQKSHGAGLQPSLNFVMRWQAAAVHDLAVDNYGRRRVDAMPLYLFGVLNLGDLNRDT